MSSRGERRRKQNDERPIIGRTELIVAVVVIAAAGITLALVLLLSGGGDDGGGEGSQAAPATATGTPFEPSDADGEAIAELGRRSVEALPNGNWPGLYDDFTREFRDRCARADFEAAGEADAANLGESLQMIRFRYLIDVTLGAETATAVIVGALGESEYTIGTAYAREDGEWKIAPPTDTDGCNGFNRLSG